VVATGTRARETVRTREVAVVGHLDDGETGVVVVDVELVDKFDFGIVFGIWTELVAPFPVIDRPPDAALGSAVVLTGTCEVDAVVAGLIAARNAFQTIRAESRCLRQ
jgi:hypothetical protein